MILSFISYKNETRRSKANIRKGSVIFTKNEILTYVSTPQI